MQIQVLGGPYHMKKTIKIFCALACGAIIALCGYSLKKNNIVAIKHVLTTKQECVDVFGDKIGKKIRNGKKSKLCPIKITVNNKTSKNLVFHETDLKTAPKKLVLKKLQPCNPIAIGLSLGLGTFLVSSVTILAASLFNPAATIALALPIVGAAYLYKEPRMLKKKIKKMYMPVGAFIGVSGLVGILLYSLSITIFAPITAATYIKK